MIDALGQGEQERRKEVIYIFPFVVGPFSDGAFLLRPGFSYLLDNDRIKARGIGLVGYRRSIS